MRIFKLIFFIVLTTNLISCKRKDINREFAAEQVKRNAEEIRTYISSNGLDMQKDANGIYYKVSGNATGIGIDSTFRYAVIKYEVRLLTNNQVIDENYALAGNKSLTFVVLNPTATNQRSIVTPRGIDMFMKISASPIRKGQKATLLMDHTLAYGTSSTSSLPPFSAIRVDMELIDVKSETSFITERLLSMGLIADRNNEGVVYSLLQPATLDVIRDSAQVTIKYVGRSLIDDRIFDSNESFTFRPYTNVIKGFTLGIPLMRKGEKGILWVTSDKAYGESGRGAGIRPFEPLYFEIQILSVVDNP